MENENDGVEKLRKYIPIVIQTTAIVVALALAYGDLKSAIITNASNNKGQKEAYTAHVTDPTIHHHRFQMLESELANYKSILIEIKFINQSIKEIKEEQLRQRNRTDGISYSE